MFENEDFLFTIVPYIIGIIFVIVICSIVFALIRNLKTWHSNNHAEREVHAAHIVSKRFDVERSGNVSASAYTEYYVTFELEDGERREFQVSGKIYGKLAEQDRGDVTFQGTRFLSFERR